MARSIAPELIQHLVADAQSVWPDNFDEIEETFNACCFAMAFQAVGKLGLFQQKKNFESMASIREKVGLFKDAEYVMTHVLRILADEKVLELNSAFATIVENDGLAFYPDWPAPGYMDTLGSGLQELIGGTMSPAEFNDYIAGPYDEYKASLE